MNFRTDKDRLVVIRDVCSKSGVKVTSSVVLSLLLLGGTAKSDYIQDKPIVGESCSKTEKFSVFDDKKRETFEKLAFSEDIEPVLSFQEKVEKILGLYYLTYEELDVCCAIACAEANGEGMNYEEASNVINVAYNRIISFKWVASLGDNLYDQMIALNQFVVYQNGSYIKFLGQTDLPGYQAVIDFLSNTTEVLPHSYLAFRSNDSNIDGVELVSGGNLYFSVLSDEDRLEDFRVRTKGKSLTLKYHKY